jgi:hypothetical protein
MDARPGHLALNEMSKEIKSQTALSGAVRRLIEERKRLLYRHMEITYHQFYSEEAKREGAVHRRWIDELMAELQEKHACIVRDEPPHRPDNDEHRNEYRWIIYWGECPWCSKAMDQVTKARP